MKKIWALFFMVWPIVAIWSFVVARARNWWFPYNHPSATPLGAQIDDLFYLILVIVAVVFIGTQVALGYVLWRGATFSGTKAWFSHGSHNLEVIWTIVPSGILLFISLFQLPVVADIRVKSRFPDEARTAPIAEVTARQFEWRIRYPSPDTSRGLKTESDVQDWLANPRADDLYSVNDLHVPSGRPVQIRLKSGDVQHAFFVPEFRIKQDAVPGLAIPVWFEVQVPEGSKDFNPELEGFVYELLCAELCGWGHFKMKGRVVAQPPKAFEAYLQQLHDEQFDDGVEDTKPAKTD
ncbi:MAG: cytochrome c oxidase subunit II [Planctomycetaceae bacterium]